jgi:ribosomal-protein-alanine N-acetyltransferase
MTIALRTPRLLLRQWCETDREPFAAMSSDPEVMAMLPKLPDRASCDLWIAETQAHWDKYGFGIWAVEIPGEVPLIGGVGLHQKHPLFPAALPPVVIAWRLARPYWGQGYAVEAARAVIDDSLGRLGFAEIVAYATIVNHRSLVLMERLGMSRDPREDFDHPECPEGHPLRRQVVYRLRRTL